MQPQLRLVIADARSNAEAVLDSPLRMLTDPHRCVLVALTELGDMALQTHIALVLGDGF